MAFSYTTEPLMVEGLAQELRADSLVVLGYELTTFWAPLPLSFHIPLAYSQSFRFETLLMTTIMMMAGTFKETSLCLKSLNILHFDSLVDWGVLALTCRLAHITSSGCGDCMNNAAHVAVGSACTLRINQDLYHTTPVWNFLEQDLSLDSLVFRHICYTYTLLQ